MSNAAEYLYYECIDDIFFIESCDRYANWLELCFNCFRFKEVFEVQISTFLDIIGHHHTNKERLASFPFPLGWFALWCGQGTSGSSAIVAKFEENIENLIAGFTLKFRSHRRKFRECLFKKDSKVTQIPFNIFRFLQRGRK